MDKKPTFPIKDVEISNVFINEKNREEKPFVTKDGKPFRKINFMVPDDTIGEADFVGKLSILVFQNNDETFDLDTWQEGNKISGNIVKNGDWWNFEYPKVDPQAQADKIAELEAELAKSKEGKSTDEDAISDEDLPF